jgi:hypothetical protein
MRKIFEFKAFDVVNNPENEEFLKKVKKQNPDLYSRFVSIIGNKGLEAAKDKYKQYDPEWLKNRYKVQKREKNKESKEQKKEEALKYLKPKMEIVQSILDNTYLKTLEKQIFNDPLIGSYLKSYGARKQYKNEFLNLLKKPLRLGNELRRTFNLDRLNFIIKDYPDFDFDDDFDYFDGEKRESSIIQIYQNCVFEPDPNFETLGTKLSYIIKFNLPRLYNKKLLSKVDKDKDLEFIETRRLICDSLSKGVSHRVYQEELNDIIFNKFKSTLTDEFYEDWQLQQNVNKYNL